jgi:hypothetical protein
MRFSHLKFLLLVAVLPKLVIWFSISFEQSCMKEIISGQIQPLKLFLLNLVFLPALLALR